MANERICEICGEPIKRLDGYAIRYQGEKGFICYACNVQIDNLQYKNYKDQAIPYLQEKIDQGKTSALGKSFIEARFVRYNIFKDAESDKSAGKSVPTYTAALEEPSNGTGLLLSGVIFFILAVILYIVSIQDVNGLKIANIQSTVFCAASFIVSMVCFACRSVITACHGKIDAQTEIIRKEIQATRQESTSTES